MSLLGDLIDQAVRDERDTTDMTMDGIEGFAHQAAVELMNALLPPMVHANNLLIKSGSWVAVEGASEIVRFTVAAAGASNEVLSGRVGDTVTEGLGHLTSNNDYARAVRSIG
ncbi:MULTISPECIES: hypothetical protein [unclassified Leifsonia]|uniref:hypothetical protein n=1 Tax=unclassified Leifsonia TaxID=2663824 RepID=UPI000B7DBCFD|nr:MULTISPECIES: hypothetical protein [unclassified Leifsonia]